MGGPLVRPDPSRGHPTGLEELANVICSLFMYDLETVRARAAADERRRAAIRARDRERQ
jgi:hypothetical protein